MTRYTNTGRKRTYLEAGFDGESAGIEPLESNPAKNESRQRHKRDEQEHDGAKKANQAKERIDRKQASETRRLKRIDTRQSETICFACREKGHAAKNCHKSSSSILDDDGLPRDNNLTGVCYRCGSQKHSLSKCRKPENAKNPLPYASCFVCSQMGHLASSCPKNAGRGIYPKGGCCKLCGQTDHLARNCRLQKPDALNDLAYFSGENAGGADEDDFHTLKRRRADLDQEERSEQRQTRIATKQKIIAANPSVVNGVSFKRPTGAKPKTVAF